jgi:hypothetical protein
MNMSILIRKCLPVLLVLLSLCGTASAFQDIWTFGFFGRFDPTASKSEFSAPDTNLLMRSVTLMDQLRPEGDKFSISMRTVELNLGGKLAGSSVEQVLLSTRSLELILNEGNVKIEFHLPTSLYTGSASAPKLVASQHSVKGLVTIGARSPNARTAPFAGTLYLELLPRLTPGSLYSFMWLKQQAQYVGHLNGLGWATLITSDQNRKDATFRIAQGLAARYCFSFESVNHPGKYLRHRNGLIILDANDGGQFAGDATFCQTFALGGILGMTPEGFSLVSYNLHDHYIVRVNDQLFLQNRQADVNWESAASYEVARPLWNQMSQPVSSSVQSPAVARPQTADTGEIDVDYYYRLINAEFGEAKSLEARPGQYSSGVTMGPTTGNDQRQYWIFVRKGTGYQLKNAATDPDQMVVIGVKAQDTDAYLYRENSIHLSKSDTAVTFEVKALGDGYFVIQGHPGMLRVMPARHRYFWGSPVLDPNGKYRNITSADKWKLFKVGPIR